MAIGTAAAIGIGLTAASSAMSFAQAGNQAKAQRQAQEDASKAMQEAKQKLEVNYYDKLSIQKEPYELEREALLAQGAQAIQAGAESERGVAATAGRVQMAMNEGQAGVRSAMGQELSGLEKLSAQEDSRLRDVGTQLNLEEVAGAQLAEANAQELGAQAMTQGMQGLTSMGQQYIAGSDLYNKQKNINPLTGDPMLLNPKQMQELANRRTQAGLTSATGANQAQVNPFAASSGLRQQGGPINAFKLPW